MKGEIDGMLKDVDKMSIEDLEPENIKKKVEALK